MSSAVAILVGETHEPPLDLRTVIMKPLNAMAFAQARLIDLMPDMVLVLDAEMRLIFANEQCRRVLMCDREHLGRDVLACVHPDDVGLVSAALAEVNGESVGPIEFRIRDALGAWHTVE